MNKLVLFSVASLTLAGILFFHTGAEAQEEAAYSGAKWEYMVVKIDEGGVPNISRAARSSTRSNSEDKLNVLGAQGWELVAVRPDGTSSPVFYLKRPKGS